MELFFCMQCFARKKILDFFFQKSPRWALAGGAEGDSGWECGLVVGVGQQGLEDGHCGWNGSRHRHWRLIPMQTLTMTFGCLLQWGREEESSEGNGNGTGGLSKPPIYSHVPIHNHDYQWLTPCMQMDDNEHPCTMEWQWSGPITLSLNIYTIKLRGHLPVIYKIFLNPIRRTTDPDPVTTMVVFNMKYFATFQLNSALHMRLIITLVSAVDYGSTKSPPGPKLVGPLFQFKP